MKSPRRIFILLCAAIVFGFHSYPLQASEPTVYSKILPPSPLGKDRILAICISKKGQSEILESFYQRVTWDQFSERHLTIMEISQRGASSIIQVKHDKLKSVRTRVRHEDFDGNSWSQAQCKNNLEFVLIGKDMGVKKRWKNAPNLDDLFLTIDAMPMRRYEMKTRSGN